MPSKNRMLVSGSPWVTQGADNEQSCRWL